MPARAPLATYRLQFNSNFRFRDAISILDYLRELGISHVYSSPVLGSRSGSGHGYDVTDPTKIDLDEGGEEEFAALQAALGRTRDGTCAGSRAESYGCQQRKSMVDGRAGVRAGFALRFLFRYRLEAAFANAGKQAAASVSWATVWRCSE